MDRQPNPSPDVLLGRGFHTYVARGPDGYGVCQDWTINTEGLFRYTDAFMPTGRVRKADRHKDNVLRYLGWLDGVP